MELSKVPGTYEPLNEPVLLGTEIKSVGEQKVRLDLGCGTNKKEGFIGVDSRAFDGVDVVCDLAKTPWPWADNSVDEVHCSHFVEHLTAEERIVFVNELYRVLKPGAGALIVVPHWNSHRAYGDLTHRWPPVSEMWFYYLAADWRKVNAPHNDFYTCDFDVTWGYTMRQDLIGRNEEYRNYAIANFKDAAQDIIATMKAKK
jgi:SAM-dependent methyltransferase